MPNVILGPVVPSARAPVACCSGRVLKMDSSWVPCASALSHLVRPGDWLWRTKDIKIKFPDPATVAEALACAGS